MEQLTCIGARDDGLPCRGARLPDSEFCVWHDPSSDRAALRRKTAPRIEHGLDGLKSAADVYQFLERLVLQMAEDDAIVPRRATAMIGGALSVLRALDAAGLERELAAARTRLAQLETDAAELERDRDQARDALSSLEGQCSALNRRSEAYRRELKYVGIDPDSIRPVP